MATSNQRTRRVHLLVPPGCAVQPTPSKTSLHKGGQEGSGPPDRLEVHKTSDDFIYPGADMTSQLNYLLARDHVAELARRAERRRQARGLLALSEERELALAERGVKRVSIAGGGLKGQQRSLAVEPAPV